MNSLTNFRDVPPNPEDDMSLGLSHSDVKYLQRHTTDVNLNEVNTPGSNLLDDGGYGIEPNANLVTAQLDLNSGTLQELPPNILSDSIVKSTPEPNQNHFVQVSGESTSLGFVTVKTGSDESAGKLEMVGSTPTCSAINQYVSTTTNALSQINLGTAGSTVGEVCNVQFIGSQNVPVQIPVQVVTSPTDSSVYMLAVTIEDPKEDGKTKTDVIYEPMEDPSIFTEPQRASTPKSPDDDVLPMDETIIAGNIASLNTDVNASKKKEAVSTSNKEEAVNVSNKEEAVSMSNKEEGVNASNKEEAVSMSNKEEGVNARNKKEAVNVSNKKEAVSASNKEEAVDASASNKEKTVSESNKEEIVRVISKSKTEATSKSKQEQTKKESRRCHDFGNDTKKKQIDITSAEKKEDGHSSRNEETHNKTFCRNWVAQSAMDTGTGNITNLNITITENAQSDSNSDHQDSKHLLDVTSVSRNVPGIHFKKEKKDKSEQKKQTTTGTM